MKVHQNIGELSLSRRRPDGRPFNIALQTSSATAVNRGRRTRSVASEAHNTEKASGTGSGCTANRLRGRRNVQVHDEGQPVDAKEKASETVGCANGDGSDRRVSHVEAVSVWWRRTEGWFNNKRWQASPSPQDRRSVDLRSITALRAGVCNLLLHVDDRDELATVNMLLATQSVLHRKPWPSHLCRPCS